ncbi:hypothetical protein BXZ70DRAFT_1000956 [Cristinia sonorae]|uniref:Uncharacterized protein n=1 Tax=Cristinia sonorae TaxID=1940300 RepID=A0A8K0UKU3_9AGAR|nr:hypothetical protein BXZ70DRAFT_1000956 [Cristinia sonorae]
MYLEELAKYKRNPKIRNPAQRASIVVARSIGKGPYWARKLRHLKLYMEHFGTLPPNRIGKHHGHPSLLNDERVFVAVRRYLTVLADGEITPAKLRKQVNDIILPGLGLSDRTTISVEAARRWLRKLGYSRRSVTKGQYIDGHERPDVVAYRERFLERMSEQERFRTVYRDEDLESVPPTLQAGEQEHIPISQDESIFHANDLQRHLWVMNGKMPLRKKGAGRAIHISDFIVEGTGRLRLTSEQIEAQQQLPKPIQLPVFDAREIIYPGKNYDGWWTAEKLIKQVLNAIKIGEFLYPGCILDFYFDQSTNHGAFAPDALNVHEMNVNPGGKQRKMHATRIPNDNPHTHLRGQSQEMERGLYEELVMLNGGKLVGVCAECKMSAKAKEKRERELKAAMAADDGDMAWVDEDNNDDVDVDPVLTSDTCCMRQVLSLQTDFTEEKSMLQTTIEGAGHKCTFLPKFHCEFNPNEMYWGWVKIRFRCLADGTFPTAKRLVVELLDACEVKTMRAFFRKTWRYMDAYGKGLTAKQVEYAVKLYKSHRRVGAAIMNLAVLDNPAPNLPH